MIVRLILTLLSLVAICTASTDHPGHMKHFGVGLKTQSPTIRNESLNPIEFHDLHLGPQIPVLFKGMAKSFVGYDNLRNDTYLSEKYGNWKVTYEPGTKEIVQKVLLHTSFKKFLGFYQQKGYYLVADLSDKNPLKSEITVPKPIMCDDMIGNLETSSFWFSGGNTRSLIHFDDNENLNCLYDGVKDVYFTSPEHADKLYLVNGFSVVDMDKVDYGKFPKLLQVPWLYAKVEAGDCIYIPYNFPHHIKSHGPRNLAVNMMWDHLLTFPNREKCEKSLPTIKDGIFTDFKHNDEIKRAKNRWVQRFTEEKDEMTEDTFCGVLMEEDEEEEEQEVEVDHEKCIHLFSQLDSNKNKRVSFKEMYLADIKIVKPFMDKELSPDGFIKNPEEHQEIKDEL